MVIFANPEPDSGLFVWAARSSVAVLSDPDIDTDLEAAGELTVCSGRLVVGAPEVVAAWGADVDTGDGSAARARMHRGRAPPWLIGVGRLAGRSAAVCPRGRPLGLTFPRPPRTGATGPSAPAWWP